MEQYILLVVRGGGHGVCPCPERVILTWHDLILYLSSLAKGFSEGSRGVLVREERLLSNRR